MESALNATPAPPPAKTPLTCQGCQTPLSGKKKKFCSLKCKVSAGSVEVSCALCGKVFRRYRCWVKRRQNTFCSYSCNGKERVKKLTPYAHLGIKGWSPETYRKLSERMKGPNNPSWKGGLSADGGRGVYLITRHTMAPPHLRCMARKDGAIQHHRLNMALHIGRPLNSGEVVHHLDHCTKNNHISNLELWPNQATHKLAEFNRALPEGTHNTLIYHDHKKPQP